MKIHTSLRLGKKAHELITAEAEKNERSVGYMVEKLILKAYDKPKKNTVTKEKETPDYIGMSASFVKAWQDWVEYKKEKKQSYKSIKTQNIAIAKLCKQCEGIEQRMIDAIYNSIGNNYSGIFESNGTKQKRSGNLTDQILRNP